MLSYPSFGREALQDFSARQLRLMFAMTPWNKEMTFCQTMREEMSAKERIFKHFFQNVDVLLRKHTPHLAMEVMPTFWLLSRQRSFLWSQPDICAAGHRDGA